MSVRDEDISALLEAALDDAPPSDLRQRVLDRLTAAKTVHEIVGPKKPDGDGDDDDDDDDEDEDHEDDEP